MNDKPDHPDSASEDTDHPVAAELDIDPVLYPPDTRPEESQTQESLTAEEQALVDDLNVYHNPEVFSDVKLLQVYKLYIRTLHLPEVPFMLDIDVNGVDLGAALFEAVVASAILAPDFDGNLEQLRREILEDSEYADAELAMRRFFVRNFPKLMVHVYNIAITMSILHVLGEFMDQPSQQKERAEIIRGTLERMVRDLKTDIKRMVGTRKTGRPKKYGTGKGPLPEIVKRVLVTANSIMGDARGKDAVPVLKTIALQLDLTENALRKQLVRSGHPWLGIRAWLEKRP